MHPSPVLSTSLLDCPLSDFLAEAFPPEQDTWLDVHKAQLGAVLVGVSKLPLIVVSGAGPLAGFGSGGRLMWNCALAYREKQRLCLPMVVSQPVPFVIA